MTPTNLLSGFAILLIIQWLSTLIINQLGIPFPPALLGMLILTVLLMTNVISTELIDDICDLLIQKMSILFLPAGVSMLLYLDIIQAQLVPIMVTLVVSSVLILLATVFVTSKFASKGGKK